MTAEGCSAARRVTKSAAFADTWISARAGMLYSRKDLSVLRRPEFMFYLMKVHVVSDVHGTADALKTAGDGADMLICLGDMLLFLDYADPTQGIFADIFGPENAREYIDLRTARRFDEARALTVGIAARLAADRGTDPRSLTEQAIRKQYAALFGALAEPAYLTYGNVDIPGLWESFRKPGHQVLDGGRAVVDGFTFGFVGAGLISPYRTPNEIPPDVFSEKLDEVGAVDVLCTHIPPAVPELLYDVRARRLETGSAALLEVIRRTQPRYAFFGHVHNPLARRVRIGRTECVNVGHFRATRVPYVVDL
jgi:Icc-related predicted phosphoesterase